MNSKLSPYFWSGLTMALAMGLTFLLLPHEKAVIEASGVTSPDVSVAPATGYFLGVVALMAVILFLIPVSKLRLVFRLLFAFMYAWGSFLVVGLLWPAPAVSGLPVAAVIAALVAGLSWLFWTRIWLHDLLLLITLAAAGSVFGFFFSPWTFMIFMLLIAVYDLLAVRFGFMVWMADKLSESTTLPAFIFPKRLRDWKLRPQAIDIGDLAKSEPGKREYSVLGGGDIGFPIMLSVSVFFAADLGDAAVVGAFGFAGLMSAFLIQQVWLKGKPMPALPPIAAFCLAGLLVTTVVI